jgi:hypothetical protein
MANGFQVAVLKQFSDVSGWNPARKIAPLGFLQMLLSRMDDSVQFNQRFTEGHERDMTVWFRRRPLRSEVRTEDAGCGVAAMPIREEFSLPGLLHREVSFHIPIATIRKYEQEASRHVQVASGFVNQPNYQASVMKEVYDLFIEYGNALFSAINLDLVTQMATKFGVNTTTGSNATKAVQFNLGTTFMNDALIQLMTDWRENELTDDVAYVGSGPFSNLDLVKRFLSGTNNQGINLAAMANALNSVWFDKDARAIWGANQIGAFAKGSVHLLTRDYYVGDFKEKLGNSYFFNMALPVQDQVVPLQYLDRLKIDVQIQEVDCPTEMLINDVPTQVGPGVVVYLKKDFSLFTVPELYKSGDPLEGTNGTLRYTVTACDVVCPS